MLLGEFLSRKLGIAGESHQHTSMVEPMNHEEESSSAQRTRRLRTSKLKKWASEHKWEIFWGLLFAWVMARFVFPPDHKPYWVRVLEYRAIDAATVKQFEALRLEWNDNPPRLGDVPVRLELITADDSALKQQAEKLTHDEDTLLVIGHLPTGLTKQSLLSFMRASPPIPYIATTASADNLCDNCDNSHFLPWLQPSPSNTKEAESMLLFAKQQGKSRCLIVTDQSPPSEEYSDELAKDISNLAKSRDVSIVNTYKMGAGPLPSESDLQQLNPDCVLYSGNADIALTLWRWLASRNQWLLLSDGVVETDKLGELATLPTDSVFFTYATNAADATKSVYASDAVGIARTLLDDLNRRGGSLSYRLRALIHFEGVQSARYNLNLVVKDNAENRSWYACNSSWDHVCTFERNRRKNGLFHVWQQYDTNHAGALSMKDIDGWHPPEQVDGLTSVHLATSVKATD
jgi:hypothetical protein